MKRQKQQVNKSLKTFLKKIGTWDYKIVSFSSESEETILNELKRLGSQRWECFWVEPIPGGKRFYLKSAAVTYKLLVERPSSFLSPGQENSPEGPTIF
jgi:hypothetical protein